MIPNFSVRNHQSLSLNPETVLWFSFTSLAIFEALGCDSFYRLQISTRAHWALISIYMVIIINASVDVSDDYDDGGDDDDEEDYNEKCK